MLALPGNSRVGIFVGSSMEQYVSLKPAKAGIRKSKYAEDVIY
jgi:hypothetical protein